MILGRERELAHIEAMIQGARQANGASLVLRGEAGIGKTALLAAARERATDMRVLAVCGVETEANLPFAALAEIVAPMLGRLDRLPAPQAAALAGALALGPPDPGDRFAVCVATLGLLRDAAERSPLLVLVDDAHWLDPASADCLAFVARRLGGTRLALLLAVRDGEDVRSGIAALPEQRVAPLCDGDAQALVATAGSEVAAGVRDAVVAAAGGNPLALREITTLLSADERAGRTPLAEPLRPGARFAALFERRVRDLPASTRDALLVAAAAGGGDVATIRRACGAAGIDERGLESAESALLIQLRNGRLQFSHPLARSAAYHCAPPPRQRIVHRALATVVAGDRRAWHLAAAAEGPDEEAAQALQQAGVAASQRRGYVEAALAHEHAASLSADLDRRARRLLRACHCRLAAGQYERALALLDQAIALGTRTALDPRTLHMRSVLLIGTGQVAPAFELLQGLAEAVAAVADPVTAAFVTADAALAALLAGDARQTLSFATRASTLLGEAGDAGQRAHVLSCLSMGQVFAGDAAGARATLTAIEPLLGDLDPLDWTIGMRTQSVVMHAYVTLEEYEHAREQARAVLTVIDEVGALMARAIPLSHAADAAHRLGEWDVAWRESEDAIAVAEETGSGEPLVRAMVVRARIASARGAEAAARAQIARATQLAEQAGNATILTSCRAVLGFLELGLGNIAAAIAHLEPLSDSIAHRHGLTHATIIPWRADLCEAYVVSGRLDDARREAATLAHEAQVTGGAVAGAMSARVQGLLAGEDFAVFFQRALACDDARPARFERARTLLAYGERLHRARRRAEARPVLREAEGIFAALGARPWLARTVAELRAAGAVRRAPRNNDPAEFTAQEVRVAGVIARGLTNRQAAAELFLSPKTIDFHLRQVYAKLGISSRAQLAVVAVERGWLGGAQETPTPPRTAPS